jgi:hypothetical protein
MCGGGMGGWKLISNWCCRLPRGLFTGAMGEEDGSSQLLRTRDLGCHQTGHRILLLNHWNLASILGKSPKEIREVDRDLPQWILILTLAGYDRMPKERVKYQDEDTTRLAQFCGLKLESAIPHISDVEMYKLLQRSSGASYWKLRYKGSCQEIFFLSPMNKLPLFISLMHSMVAETKYPASEVGIYIQPQHQGVAWHCEFDLFYDPNDPILTKVVYDLYVRSSEELFRQGAYFSRPYGIWADLVYNRDSGNSYVLKELKKIFDPNNVMNPGKLCF